LDTASIERLHQLRIEVKRLRYTIESLREVLGSEKKAVIRELIRLQDHLGDLNDADVACHVLGKYLDSWRARQVDLSFAERQDPEPVVAFLAAKQAERHHLLGEFGLRWERFMQSDFRKNLAWAVAVL
jgi:CHAD domain-containing protein